MNDDLLRRIIAQQRILEKVQLSSSVGLTGITASNIAKYASIQEKIIKNETLFSNSFSSQLLNQITKNSHRFDAYIQTANTIANIINPTLSKFFASEVILERLKQKNISSFEYVIGTEFESYDDNITDLVEQAENNGDFIEEIQQFSEDYVCADDEEKQELISSLFLSAQNIFSKYKKEVILAFIELLIATIISIHISNLSTKEIVENNNSNTEILLEDNKNKYEKLNNLSKKNTDKIISNQDDKFAEAENSRSKNAKESKDREDEILNHIKHQVDYVTLNTKLYSEQKADSSYIICDLRKYTEIRMIDRKTGMSLVEVLETKQKGWIQNQFLKDFE